MTNSTHAHSDPSKRTDAESDQPIPTESKLQGLLASAIHGFDPDAAREAGMILIHSLHRQLSLGPEIHSPALLEYLRHALERMVKDQKNVSADIAFSLKRGPGRAREPRIERDLHIAAQVILFVRAGETWEEAIAKTAQLLFSTNSGERTVQKAYGYFHDAINSLSDEALLQILSATAFKPPGV